MKPSAFVLAAAVMAICLLPACANRHHEHAHEHQHEYFVPGLGEIMAQTATRHAKLWFAGQTQNWALAAYEVDELKEGFEDAGKYHPTHKNIVQPIPELIAKTMDQPLAAVDQAIKDKNQPAFVEQYDKLTAACNACHQGSDFGFNVVTRPSFNPFANQAFGAGK